MVPLKGYDKKLVCLLNETKQSYLKICPLTPLVPASSFYVFFVKSLAKSNEIEKYENKHQ